MYDKKGFSPKDGTAGEIPTLPHMHPPTARPWRTDVTAVSTTDQHMDGGIPAALHWQPNCRRVSTVIYLS